MPNNATMPIPQEWLRDLLDNEGTPGDFLSPDDVVLDEDGEAEGPPSRRMMATRGGRRGGE